MENAYGVKVVIDMAVLAMRRFWDSIGLRDWIGRREAWLEFSLRLL
jgi:hypothetical protein